MYEEDRKMAGYIIAGVAAFLFVGWVLTSLRTVQEGEVGVVKNWGKVQEEYLNPGIHFRSSIGYSITKMETRIKKTEMNASAGTKDLQSVSVKVAVNYRLDSKAIVSIYRDLGDDDSLAERIINPAIQEVVKANASKFTAAELLTKRPEFKDLVDTQLTERLTPYNILVGDVSVVDLSYSAAFDRAVEAKQVAEQQNQQAAYELEKAKKEIERMRLEKAQISQQTLQKMWIEKWDGKLPTYVGDSKFLLNLPTK